MTLQLTQCMDSREKAKGMDPKVKENFSNEYSVSFSQFFRLSLISLPFEGMPQKTDLNSTEVHLSFDEKTLSIQFPLIQRFWAQIPLFKTKIQLFSLKLLEIN